MKNIKKFLLVSILIPLFTFSCTNDTESGSSTQKGGVKLNVNFNQLLNNTRADADEVIISSVEITLTRSGYSDVVEFLTVNNNIATGTIDNLEQGYWHLTAKVYDDTSSLIFTGEEDVLIIAEKTVSCIIYFDPATDTTGNVDITVGLNPLPGYKKLGISTSQILVSEENVYILDSSSNIIAVYNENMQRIKDISLAESPAAITFNYDKSAILLGYTTGDVYKLDLSNDTVSLLCNTGINIGDMKALNNTYLLAMESLRDTNFILMDITTNTIADTMNAFFRFFNNLEYNPLTSSVYLHNRGSSPEDIHCLKIDLTTGDLIRKDELPYHGDYPLGTPIRLIMNNTRVITNSGNMFLSTDDVATDMQYTANIGYTYIDLACNDIDGKIYLINSDTNDFVTIDSTNLFTISSLELKGNPQNLFHTTDNIIVFVEYNGEYFTKVFTK